MGVSIWVAGPVTILGVLALLSAFSLGSGGSTFGDVAFSSGTDQQIFYDVAGAPKVYANSTNIDEPGKIENIPILTTQLFWSNATGNYPLYVDAVGGQYATMDMLLTSKAESGGFNATIGTALGILAVIIGICAVGILASIKVFGTGLSDVGVNTLMKGGAYIMIWAIFSGLAMTLIVASADFFTPVIWLALTGVYAFGVMGEIGTPSGGGS